MAKRKTTLLHRLEQAKLDLVCACDCDGRGCTICNAADAMLDAINALSIAEANVQHLLDTCVPVEELDEWREDIQAAIQHKLSEHRQCLTGDGITGAQHSSEVIGFHRGLHWVLGLLEKHEC